MTTINNNNYPTDINEKADEIPIKLQKRVSSKKSLGHRLCSWFSPRKAGKELCDPLFWHDVLIETVLCVFYNCSVVWVGVSLNDSIYKPNIMHFGLYAGFLIFAVIEGWAPICGSSVNISRTWAVFICGRMTPIKVLVYMIVEVGGGAAGAVLAFSLTPLQYKEKFIAILPAPGVTDFMCMMIEAILTFNLIIISLCVSDSKLKDPPRVMGSFPVGFAVATGILAAGTHTGGLQNPVVALTYSMLANNYTAHWAYWIGPILGSTVATLFYMAMEQLRERYGPYNPPKEEPEIEEKIDDVEINNNKAKNGIRQRVIGIMNIE